MNFTAIICELNPLTIGHKKIIEEAKKLTNNPIICIMSGNFVQRGEPAILDKYTRAKLAIKAGAQVPFMRSAETANDYASTDDVIREVLDNYKNHGQQFDTFCCIYPTAPFITPERLKEAMALLDETDSVMPVVAFSYPVQRAVVIEDGELKRKWPEYANSRSQDLEPFYHDVGQFYACRTEAFYREGTTDTVHMKPMILNDTEVQDIDTFEDWAIAEMKYKLLHPQE